MRRRSLPVILLGLLLLGFEPGSQAAYRVKVGTSVRVATYDLIFWAAEEKGFWQDNGLEVEWVPFRGGGFMYRAMAAGAVKTGMSSLMSGFQAASRGIPVKLVYGVLRSYSRYGFGIWVRNESRMKEPSDLKGARLGINRFGGANHAYGRLIINGLGLREPTKFLAVGGTPEAVAALKAGRIDAVVTTAIQILNLKSEGVLRELVSATQFLPKEWTEEGLFATRESMAKEADTLARLTKAVTQTIDFLRKDPPWAQEKMKGQYNYSKEAARSLYDSLIYTQGGQLSLAALNNFRNFLIEYGIVAKGEAPALEEFYTDQFIR